MVQERVQAYSLTEQESRALAGTAAFTETEKLARRLRARIRGEGAACGKYKPGLWVSC